MTIYARMLAHDRTRVDPERWKHAVETRTYVGECTECRGGKYVPSEPVTGTLSRIAWYEGTCTGCGHEIALPDGRVGTRRTI